MKRRGWINYDIDISDFSDKLGKFIFEIIKEAEEAESKGEVFTFYNVCEDIEMQSKLLLEDGVITDEQWERLCTRYYPDVPEGLY
jgi:hypothetical protein